MFWAKEIDRNVNLHVDLQTFKLSVRTTVVKMKYKTKTTQRKLTLYGNVEIS